MHDLIHDMAASYSMDECLVMGGPRNQNESRVQNTVRHMSIMVGGESLTGMGDIQHLNKLHSLRFGIRFNVEITWFNQLSNILFLSLKSCKLVKLPDSICKLNSLRYLDISHSSVQELPNKFWCLYSLQVLDASRSSLKTIHQDVTKLINLRQLALPTKASDALSRVRGLGHLSFLRNLSDFRVSKDNGRGIGELKVMNKLNGKLCIRSLHNVGSEEEAFEARLVEKQYLKELVLYWRENTTLSFMPNEDGVLEGLRPHSRIECLIVHRFRGNRFPSWFKPQDLPTLRRLELYFCNNITSIPVHSFVGFACLQDLKLRNCFDLECPQEMVFPPSLRRLCLVGCFALERSFPACLRNLTSLTLLQLAHCKVTCIPLNSIGSNMLKCLDLRKCPELTSIGGSHDLASIQYVELSDCPKLTEVQLPFKKNELRTEEKAELLTFLETKF
jgi:Leucine-rich repeat (LRR) protein